MVFKRNQNGLLTRTICRVKWRRPILNSQFIVALRVDQCLVVLIFLSASRRTSHLQIIGRAHRFWAQLISILFVCLKIMNKRADFQQALINFAQMILKFTVENKKWLLSELSVLDFFVWNFYHFFKLLLQYVVLRGNTWYYVVIRGTTL